MKDKKGNTFTTINSIYFQMGEVDFISKKIDSIQILSIFYPLDMR